MFIGKAKKDQSGLVCPIDLDQIQTVLHLGIQGGGGSTAPNQSFPISSEEVLQFESDSCWVVNLEKKAVLSTASELCRP